MEKEIEFVTAFVTDEVNLATNEDQEKVKLVLDTIKEAIKIYHKNVEGV